MLHAHRDLRRALTRAARQAHGDPTVAAKVAILAGGRGTRLAEETDARPKPLVEIGSRPLLWHIMRHYAHYGWTDFVIALGYRGDDIRRYLFEGADPGRNGAARHRGRTPASTGDPSLGSWSVTLVDTGPETNTGGRIKRLAPHLGEGTFFLTWGDGVSDVDLRALLAFHRAHGRLATVTAVRPPARFGRLDLDGDEVTAFSEKLPLQGEWINGAFFVLEPEALDWIDDDETHWEGDSLPRLARDGQLMAYRHEGFWQCMDTLHDKRRLEDLWAAGAPWRVWD